MSISVNSKAAGVGAAVKNVQFSVESTVVQRKILIVATYDPLKTSVVEDVAVQVFSPEDAADQFGFGSMAHRLAIKTFLGGEGVETWIAPQAEGGTAADGEIDFVGSTGVLAGTYALYIAGDRVPVTITAAMTADNIATAVAAAINADTDLPITATALTTVVTIAAKMEGTYGNFVSITENLLSTDVTPTGVASAITDMANGATDPDIQDALDALGTGDDANENAFTGGVQGYGPITATLDAISNYVGAGNTATGLYGKTVARPFRFLTGDVVADTAGLTAVLAVANARKLDRANGIISVPGSQSHPSEIAAQALGVIERINNNRAEESYAGKVLTGVFPGAKADRWTSEYDNRDTAVKAGVSPTKIASGVVTLQNVMSFYHPDNVPADSNGYASMRNISITQNILANVKALFEQERFQGVSIVEDTTQVSTVLNRQKAIDTDIVKDYLTTLIQSFYAKAWIYNASFPLERLADADAVTIRSGTTGFDIILDLIYSGEGSIYDNLVRFDTSIAVLG